MLSRDAEVFVSRGEFFNNSGTVGPIAYASERSTLMLEAKCSGSTACSTVRISVL